jgi:hypothetical protein
MSEKTFHQKKGVLLVNPPLPAYGSQLPVEVDGKVCPLVQILLMGGILDEACQVFKYWIADPGLINPL